MRFHEEKTESTDKEVVCLTLGERPMAYQSKRRVVEVVQKGSGYIVQE